MLSICINLLKRFKNALRALAGKKPCRAVIKTAARSKKLFRSIRCFLKVIRRGKFHPCATGGSLVHSLPGYRGFCRFRSSASYILTEEAFFPLN